ncbi:MAG: hypothetical protein EA398_05480 [Deltaproteobacteria bacterium]|nr:MAG: hypothetical protein EA398_05480 [Deltaproteobacteria bacterium]
MSRHALTQVHIRFVLLVSSAALLLVLVPGCRDSASETCTSRECLDLPGRGGNGTGEDPTAGTAVGSQAGSSVSDLPVQEDAARPGDPCSPGERACSPSGEVLDCPEDEFVVSGPCPENEICSGGRCVPPADCEPGIVQGCASDFALLVCGEDGNTFLTEPCEDGLTCWAGQCQELACRPGSRRCASDLDTEICNEDGTGWTPGPVCNQAEGEVCSEGFCDDPCDFFSKERTYIGCSYWAVDLPMFADPTDFSRPDQRFAAVVLANLSERTTEVQVVSYGEAQPEQSTYTIPPNGTTTIQLPDQNISGSGSTMNSVHITTSLPVTAYQFKPLDNVGAASNDASLLLPDTSLGNEYFVVTWPSGTDLDFLGDFLPGGGSNPLDTDDGQFGYFTIVGTSPGTTTVTVRFSTDTLPGPDMPAFPARSVQQFEIQQGEVLNFESASEIELIGGFIPRATSRDFTGTRVTSTQPIAVFAGHKQAVLGEGGGPDGDQTCCADRLEQQLFPVSTWGSEYLVVKAAPRGTEPDFYRVIAARDNTSITTNPTISGVHGQTLNAGEFVEFSTPQSFELIATEPVMIGQFLTSQQTRGAGGIGDPTFILQVPRSQFRRDYLVAVPRNYNQNWLSIVKPGDEIIRVNNQPVPESSFTEIANTGWRVGYVPVEAGAVRVESADVFGIYVTGYSGAVSYGYPGGLNLTEE